MTDTRQFRIQALLSIQRALIDEVTPNLRAVAMRIQYPHIEARFLYESVTAEEIEDVSLVETYVIADFHPDVVVTFTAVTVPFVDARVLLDEEEWVYMRREPLRYPAGPA